MCDVFIIDNYYDGYVERYGVFESLEAAIAACEAWLLAQPSARTKVKSCVVEDDGRVTTVRLVAPRSGYNHMRFTIDRVTLKKMGDPLDMSA